MIYSPTAFGKPINHVFQKHRHGCVPASLAMVLGKSYEEAVSILSPNGDPDWEHGFTFQDFDSALAENGWSVSRKFRFTKGNIERSEWPPKPWGEIHMALVRCSHNSSHAVILMRDGLVLDPLTERPKILKDYVAVDNVAALYPTVKIT
jgi:hypothetical protein